MFDLNNWQEILNSIQRHKLRTLLTAFGVFWGIFMLVILLGVGRGLEKGVYAQFRDVASNSFFVWAERTSVAYKGLNPGRWIELNLEDFEAIRKNVPDVRFISANAGLWGESTVRYQDTSRAFNVQGVCPEYIRIESREILKGRFLNAPDMDEKRKVAVIGKRVKEVFFGDDEPLGQYININNVFFQVVGVFDMRKTGTQGRDPTELIYIPLLTLQKAFLQRNRVGWFSVRVADHISAAEVETQVKELLRLRHLVSPEDENAIGSWNMEKEFKNFQELFQGINIFIWIVGIGTMFAGIVGVSNIMLIIVKERTREIGIRKALGATPFSIISQILQESVFITAVAGYLGLVAGVVVIEIVNYVMVKFNIQSEFFRNPEIEFNMAITATILLVVIGALAGLIPARKAATINPIEALRSE